MVKRVDSATMVQTQRAELMAEIFMLNAEIEAEELIDAELESFGELCRDWLAFSGLFLFLALVLWPLGVR